MRIYIYAEYPVSVTRHEMLVVISKPYYIFYYSKSHILTYAAEW